MQNEASQIIDYFNKAFEHDHNVFLANGEMLFQKDAIEFYSYLIQKHNSDKEFLKIVMTPPYYVSKNKSSEIEIFPHKNHTIAGTVDHNGIATIDGFSFSAKNYFKNIDNFLSADRTLPLFYVPNKGLYHIRTASFQNKFVAKMHPLYLFTDKKNDVNLTYKVTNKTEMIIHSERHNQKVLVGPSFIYINELDYLNTPESLKQISLNPELFEKVKDMPKHPSCMRFKCFPMFEKSTDKTWSVNLIYTIYIIVNDLYELIESIETNKNFYNIHFDQIYSLLTENFNKKYQTDLKIDRNSNIDEIKSIMKTFDY